MTSSMGCNIAICGAIHIPSGDIAWMYDAVAKVLQKLDVPLYCSLTPATDSAVTDFLTGIGVTCLGQPEISNAHIGYTQAMRPAMDDPTIEQVLYVDFDRLLHWAYYYADELTSFVQDIKNGVYGGDLYILERTPRAYATHHEALIATEKIANTYISKQLSLDSTKDFLSGAWLVQRGVASEWCDTNFRDRPTMLYSAWPCMAYRAGYSVGFVVFEGLEWETADPFYDIVADVGIDTFRSEFSTEQEWRRRVLYLEQILDGCHII